MLQFIKSFIIVSVQSKVIYLKIITTFPSDKQTINVGDNLKLLERTFTEKLILLFPNHS